MEPIKYIWKDRKRILGMPLTFTRYRLGEDRLFCEILGVKVAEVVIPVSAGRDLVNLVETAAQQHKLRTAGYDAAKELDEQLKRRALA